MSTDLLRGRSLAELENLYVTTRTPGAAPRGSYAGEFLCWVDSPGARRPDVRALDTLMFRAVRFGVDFDAQRWWFVRPSLRAGRFRVSAGRSRWRDTETLRLEYDVSRLPRFVRTRLYDEVKPLADGLVLGLGGINREAGVGEHFFFALTRQG